MKRRVLEEAGCFSGDSTPSDARDVNSGVKMDGWKKAVAAAESWRELAILWNNGYILESEFVKGAHEPHLDVDTFTLG